MNLKRLTAFLAVSLGVALALTGHGLGQGTTNNSGQVRMAPTFQVDPTWPKLPNNWVTGPVSWVATGPKDHVWIIHRYRFVAEGKKEHVAPPVLEFDEKGAFVRGWGGDAKGYDWPSTEHGIFVDYKGNIWLTGNGSPAGVVDNMVLKFSSTGQFLLQIGGRGQPGGHKDTRNLERASDVDLYRKTNEVVISDGYGNRRVIVFDADTGAFKRQWGAFGKPPDDEPPAPVNRTANAGSQVPPSGDDGPQGFANPVHAIKVSRDGLVYVCDRTNRRVQVFTVDGKYVNQVFINRTQAPSASGLAFSPDSQQTYLYVGDYGNSHVVVINRKTLEVLYQFGKRSSEPGDFQGIHGIAVDAKGNLYTAEVAPGSRAQKFVLKGMATLPVPSLIPRRFPLASMPGGRDVLDEDNDD